LLQNITLRHLLKPAALIRITLTAPSCALLGALTVTLLYAIRVLVRHHRNIALPDSIPPPNPTGSEEYLWEFTIRIINQGNRIKII
jgi:hypothetical protein